MPKVCGELTAMSSPTGGGVHVSETVYRNVRTGEETTRQSWYKSRMEFPLIRIGNTTLEKVFVAGDPLGHQIAEGISEGEHVCLYFYGHLLRKKVIIGIKSDSGLSFLMPAKGLLAGLFWYAVFSPIIVSIAASVVGMAVGMLGGRRGTALGLLFGVLYGVGISWYSGFRLFRAYREMQADVTRDKRGKDGTNRIAA